MSRAVRGFYDGSDEWKWTERTFAVSLDPPQGDSTILEMDFGVPPELLRQVPAVTITAKVNGLEVGKQKYDTEGRYTFMRRVPPQALRQRPALVEFELDKAAKDTEHGRDIGVIVVSAGLKTYEESEEFRQAQLRRSHEGYQEVLKKRALQLPLEKQHELMKLFHELPVWEHTWFHNVRIIKSPLDLWMMQQIIYEVRPDFVVETGTWYGGSALYFANVLHGMGLERSRVVTVDIQDVTNEGASAHALWKKYVDFYHGSSTDPGIVSAIAKKVRGQKVFVTLDSNHTMQHVLQELRMYAPMVSRGSYLIVEDTHLDGVPTHPEQGPGPMAAVQRFLKEGGSKDFEQDFSREAFLMTFQPGGWLRRK